MNILIVEDNRHMRRVLGALIRSAFEAIPVLEVPDAARARIACLDTQPELVLMDVGLPDASGIDLTAEIKSLLPDTTIVIVSHQRSRMSQDAARRAGAAAYIFKDDVYEQLLPVLTAVIGPLLQNPTRGEAI